MSLKKSVISEFTEVRMYVLYEMSGHDIDMMFDWELAEVIVYKKIIQSYANCNTINK